MKNKAFEIIERLEKEHSLKTEEYEYLVREFSPETAFFAAEKALEAKKAVYGNSIYIRGLIEISNICKNDCLYCGIRASNQNAVRYRLDCEDILSSCKIGYELGFRTFVMQGGEDMHFTDDAMCSIISQIKKNHPDCAITLSIGERSFDSYKKLFDAGADRYLLRHETADSCHYSKLHPEAMSFQNRMECLRNLKSIGYQVGCGFMVGSPHQTASALAKDLKFIEEFSPDMCGIGPFIPHKDTEFASYKPGSAELTCYLLSLIRLIKPNILLPATTALATLTPNGRTLAIKSGANVIMPNLSPKEARENYTLYDNKAHSGMESAQFLKELSAQLMKIDAHIVTDRGDIKLNENRKKEICNDEI